MPASDSLSFDDLTPHFDVHEKIGEGTFSSVFKAVPKERPLDVVALKRIYPISSPLRIQNEIKHLVKLG
jgi:hypothetical protein